LTKKALITGICGQDGAYLAQLLLSKGYHVVGTTRKFDLNQTTGLAFLGIKEDVELIEVTDFSVEKLATILLRYKPDEIYNLAAQSSVGLSFSEPISTIQENIMSVASWLEAIKQTNQDIRFYQASSSEMYGNVGSADLPIKEGLIFNPASPYGISKAAAHWITVNYREVHGLKAGCGILFNHESVLRGPNYVLKKVIHQAVLLGMGIQKTPIHVGNLDIKRDWGYAPEYVKAMWSILQKETIDDYHICSGNMISLKAFIQLIFAELNIDFDQYIFVDPSLFRPVDLMEIYGDNQKAKEELNWEYQLTSEDLVKKLIEEEIRFIEWEKRK
jgi:GDPmannose 4,6-dehydratase